MDNNLVLKRFFSKTTLNSLIDEGSSGFIDHVIRRYIAEPEGREYEDLIGEIYCNMGKYYRTEYYYKNTLLNKLLFKQHNYNATSVLTELPVGNAKADFVMINGNGVVYEIKTELDNLDRLTSQIDEYYKAFDRVIVVTYEKNIEKVKPLVPSKTGIMVLTKRNALKAIRGAEQNKDKFDSRTICKLLRKKEFEQIIIDSGYDLPEVSEFEYYTECYRMLSKIDVNILQKQMLKALKLRTKIEMAENALCLPEPIRFVTYFDDKAWRKRDRLLTVLHMKFGGSTECTSHI